MRPHCPSEKDGARPLVKISRTEVKSRDNSASDFDEVLQVITCKQANDKPGQRNSHTFHGNSKERHIRSWQTGHD
ncbi:hypothetical protein FH972_023947 [Carpinus fangiana]|uniref:Uncharacterized protein n=1 Tax=Carpinus fangiana TaxID=176857 RepID=A0A5N6KWN3_9ROSI|nr:hypothetical protein FH972_023947 [Carpinus fangiana]